MKESPVHGNVPQTSAGASKSWAHDKHDNLPDAKADIALDGLRSLICTRQDLRYATLGLGVAECDA